MRIPPPHLFYGSSLSFLKVNAPRRVPSSRWNIIKAIFFKNTCLLLYVTTRPVVHHYRVGVKDLTSEGSCLYIVPCSQLYRDSKLKRLDWLYLHLFDGVNLFGGW
jgi:hypothetical protein